MFVALEVAKLVKLAGDEDVQDRLHCVCVCLCLCAHVHLPVGQSAAHRTKARKSRTCSRAFLTRCARETPWPCTGPQRESQDFEGPWAEECSYSGLNN